MKKIIALSLISCILSANLLAVETKHSNDDLKYDAPNGWWWYEKKSVDEKTKEEKSEVIKLDEKSIDDKKIQLEILKAQLKLIEEQKKANEINERVAGRLEYAFPNVTPIYTTNKKTGEKCLTNSNMDCFVMPVIAEGQQVPALRDFIRDPNPANSKNWLQWQATYFNHLNKVSHGLRFAYLKDGAEAYPTEATFANGDSLVDSQAENLNGLRKAQIISSFKDQIAIMVFLGDSKALEATQKVSDQVNTWNQSYLKDIDKVFVFKSKEDATYFLTRATTKAQKEGNKEVESFWKAAKVEIRPDLFVKNNITLTPSVVAFYEDKIQNKNVSSTITTGTLSSEVIRDQFINYLTYMGAVEEKDLNPNKTWNLKGPQAELPKPKPIKF